MMVERCHNSINYEKDHNSVTGIKEMFKSDSQERKKSFKEILKDLVESSSLHGVPKIISSRQLAVKALWCLLFLGTFSVLVMQLSGLFKTFYSYPIQTSVSLEFNSINFPAISICNMNPVRNSKLNMSEALLKILAEGNKNTTSRKKRSVNKEMKVSAKDTYEDTPIRKAAILHDDDKTSRQLDKDMGTLIQPTPVVKDDKSERINSGLHERDIFNLKASRLDHGLSEKQLSPAFLDKEVRRRKRVAILSSVTRGLQDPLSSVTSSLPLAGVSLVSSAGSALSSSIDSWQSWYDSTSSYYYDYEWWLSWNYYYQYSSYDYYSYQNSWNEWSDPNVYLYSQLSSKKDLWDERVELFRTVFKNESIENRRQMGHQKEDLIMSASFAGSLENVTKFQNFTSSQYGNCFTLSSPRYVAWRSGPSHGIKMTLNLEIDEYVSNFSTGYGIRLVLHEPGTYPLPTDEGLTLGPGTETNIGLKLVRLSRLGEPYSDCVKGLEFAKRYKKKYSTSACYQFCRIIKTMEVCKCIPVDAPDDISLNSTALPVCNSTIVSEKICLLNIDIGFNNGNYECDCQGPCKEVVFEKTMSSRYWPTHDYMNVLLSEICEKNSSKDITYLNDICENIDNLTYEQYEKYRNNFLRVIIYFEDLNYETISQEPLYESVRFLSDIGGAMGLFLGASVLSLVEFLQLFLEIVLYIRGRVMANKTTKVQVIKN
ncbi:degenerin mec-4-like [Mercenaria mercenaria]|uniref:degenerin mec-4-like n=1 Tax=Mercenaria mercenaria TaxID=6596 RepID=UPI00234F30AE|nr:degenerin mec-4-like [Mercenaria mercenaria]